MERSVNNLSVVATLIVWVRIFFLRPWQWCFDWCLGFYFHCFAFGCLTQWLASPPSLSVLHRNDDTCLGFNGAKLIKLSWNTLFRDPTDEQVWPLNINSGFACLIIGKVKIKWSFFGNESFQSIQFSSKEGIGAICLIVEILNLRGDIILSSS